MDKIGKEGVAEELEKEGFAKESIDKYLSLFDEVTEDVNGVRRLKELLEGFLDQKIAEELETIIQSVDTVKTANSNASTTVDNRGYLLIFNNHLPKQHFKL